ncbi:Uncharacterised protein [Mycobacteroides abscessus subsp. massiliense]|nr:Uncharacterised protein [Mycobacteroides abscessus subsp. massiliense]SLH10633.1 Uncharacterised protein [Mycobacteroides abscessus subsp. massiliense]SLI03332.1 Uncharacterised protein [Mycobacteroides abscessus subsp. massiliense]
MAKDQGQDQDRPLTTMEKLTVVATYAAAVAALNQSGTPR